MSNTGAGVTTLQVLPPNDTFNRYFCLDEGIYDILESFFYEPKHSNETNART